LTIAKAVQEAVVFEAVVVVEGVLHWPDLSVHTHVVELGLSLCTELKLFHVWLVLLGISVLVFFSWGSFSLQAVLVDLEVAVYEAATLFGGLGSKFLSSVCILGHKTLLGWRYIHTNNCLWVIVPMRAPYSSFWWCFHYRRLMMMSNFRWTWRDIANLLLYDSLRQIMLLEDWFVPWWVDILSRGLIALLSVW
jgi:hypothetical protein